MNWITARIFIYLRDFENNFVMKWKRMGLTVSGEWLVISENLWVFLLLITNHSPFSVKLTLIFKKFEKFFAVIAAQGKFRARLQNYVVIAAEHRVKFFDAVNVDDGRAVNS